MPSSAIARGVTGVTHGQLMTAAALEMDRNAAVGGDAGGGVCSEMNEEIKVTKLLSF